MCFYINNIITTIGCCQYETKAFFTIQPIIVIILEEGDENGEKS